MTTTSDPLLAAQTQVRRAIAARKTVRVYVGFQRNRGGKQRTLGCTSELARLIVSLPSTAFDVSPDTDAEVLAEMLRTTWARLDDEAANAKPASTVPSRTHAWRGFECRRKARA